MHVSAIVPTYNRSHLLWRPIESIFAQAFKDMEIVIVDDGSTDATEGMVRGYQGRSVPIRYVRKPNGGCASARNRGVELASGDCIAFLDSDDEWLPDAIGSLVEALVRANADFVYSPSVEQVTDVLRFTSAPAAAGKPEMFAAEHFLSGRARSCSVLYRRRVFERFRFDETLRFNEDSDFLQRVALNFKAAYSPVPSGVVHHHAGNKSNNRVALCRSVLKSTDSILREYPEFCLALSDRGQKRRCEVHEELVRALLADGDVGAARAEAAGDHVGLGLGLLLRLGWGAPLRWHDLVQQTMARAASFKKRAGW
jgi:glycosyltransferase involved in cell wall biosynthesis